MSHNIGAQFTTALNNCFNEGTDKHAWKEENGSAMGWRVFSYGEKYRLQGLGKDLGHFLKEQYPEVKQVSQIQPQHVQDFLNSKISTCTQNTINSYVAGLCKLQNAANHTFSSCNLNWKREISTPAAIKDKAQDKGVESVISRKDYNKLLGYCQDSKAQSSYAIRLQDSMGIRVEELPRIKLNNIDLAAGTITIYGKGGRELIRQLQPDQISLVKEIIGQKFSSDRLFSISGASINQQLKRLEDKLGIPRHSNHDIRRLIAQEHYDKYRAEGCTVKEAADKTSAWLSHGSNRDSMLERSYIQLR